VTLAVSLALAVPALAIPISASAQLAPPWDGNPISPGLGPTYGEAWCAEAAPGSSIANQQGPPLALLPVEAIGCTLDQLQAEAADAGIPPRMSYEVIGQSTTGWDMYGVVVNALETPEQQRDSDRWFQLRDVLLTDPAAAQGLLAEWGSEVKLPIYVEANIHGGEEEGTDAMMQVLRDLVTLPYGTNAVVDGLLDHAIVILVPSQNPDGRFAGTRSNGNGFDMNRDLLVQSQQEIRNQTAFMLEWLAPVGLFMHGYVNPTLIDGLTKPHNPGLEYDLFLKWNQPRLDVNEAALADVGMGITRPVNQWNGDAEDSPPPVGPPYAEGWDDWGPFYTQTYGAFFGVDGSTLEMCSSGPGCDGRFGSKRAQYVGFYSSAVFWLDNRNEILHDQAEIFRRGVVAAPRPNCCDDPDIAARGFTEDQHNWMVPYPRAFVIPFDGILRAGQAGAQRSDAEANRLAQWLLDNGVQVHAATRKFGFEGQTFQAGSYVVWMKQPLRGIALTALDEGQDISDRITQLYAPPGAWSHGQLWGADVVEIPAGAPRFVPQTVPIAEPTPLEGAVRPDKANFYTLQLRGATEIRAVLELLRVGIDAEIAEASFSSPSGTQPAGTLIFGSDPATVAALQDTAEATGVVFERGRAPKPPVTQLDEAPKVAVLVNSSAPATNDTLWSLRQIFGADVAFVSTVNGPDSLQNAVDDPLLGYDVIYNAGQNYPSAANATAQGRLQAFFARGGGYIGTSQSANNFAFLSGAGLVTSPLSQTSDSAGGGIARWDNVGLSGPLTGGYPVQDFLYLPSNVTYFSAVPAEAVVDGRYLPDTTSMFVAGLWLDRDPLAAGAPMAVHGVTTAGSRFAALSTNPFSRGDAEREWLFIGQAVLWSNLTDEA
jgi:hypothetical protein